MKEFAAYFDDSGHPSDQDMVLVAGFVSSEEQWLLFDKEWKALLAKYEVKHFHMVDCVAGEGEFSGWGAEKKQIFLIYQDSEIY